MAGRRTDVQRTTRVDLQSARGLVIIRDDHDVIVRSTVANKHLVAGSGRGCSVRACVAYVRPGCRAGTGIIIITVPLAVKDFYNYLCSECFTSFCFPKLIIQSFMSLYPLYKLLSSLNFGDLFKAISVHLFPVGSLSK